MEIKILLVDDEEIIREVLGQFLFSQKYQVVSAKNGKEALNILREEKDIKIIITDMLMPEMSGFEFIQELRKEGINLPIIALSGYLGDDSKIAMALKELGVKEILAKPVDFPDLLNSIQKSWKKYLEDSLKKGDLEKENSLLRQSNQVLQAILQHQKNELDELKRRQKVYSADSRVLGVILQSTDVGIAVGVKGCLRFRCCSASFRRMLEIDPEKGVVGILSHPQIIESGFSDAYFSEMSDSIKKLEYNIEIRGKTIQLGVYSVCKSEKDSKEVLFIARDISEKVFVRKLEEQKAFNREKLLLEVVEKAKREKYVDGLTKVDNRRSFDETFDSLVSSEQTFMLVIFDIDRFKNINDTYGHTVGDEALVALAGRLKGSSSGFIARYGGEEFVAILPGCKDFSVAQRIREAICGEYHLSNSLNIQITVSAGAGIFKPGENPDDFIKEVDGRLYMAKSEGRDRLVCG